MTFKQIKKSTVLAYLSVAGGDGDAEMYGFAAGLLEALLLEEVNDARRSVRDTGEAVAERGEPGTEDMESVERDGVSEEGEGRGTSCELANGPDEDSLRRNSTQRWEKDWRTM